MVEVDGPYGGDGQLPLDGAADLVLVFGRVLQAELGQCAADLGGVGDASHGTRGDDAGVARGEEPGLVVLLHEDGLHVHGDGNADARVALPVVGLLAAGGTGVDEEDVAVEHVREWRGIGVAVRVDGGDDAVLAVAQDFARLVSNVALPYRRQ